MNAALLEAHGQPLRIRNIDIRDPGVGQMRVRVHNCGVCHSDLSVADGVFPSPTPIVLGHEAAGVVDAVGPGVSGLAPGDHVVLTPCPPCGACYWCVRGEPTVCVNALGLQTNALPDGTTGLSMNGEVVYRGIGLGAFAEYVLAPATGAVKVADDVPLEVACVIGCAVQTGVGAALNTAKIVEGATVLVIGLGGIGLSIIQGARLAGASRIIGVDPLASKREVATGFGATAVIDPTSEDVAARVSQLTGVGADYAFDAVGRAELIQLCLALTRTGGTTVCVGAPPMTDVITIPIPAMFVLSEKKLLGCALGSSNSLREIPRLIALWQAGRLDLEGLITARRPLSEVNEAFADMRAGKGIRTVLAM